MTNEPTGPRIVRPKPILEAVRNAPGLEHLPDPLADARATIAGLRAEVAHLEAETTRLADNAEMWRTLLIQARANLESDRSPRAAFWGGLLAGAGCIALWSAWFAAIHYYYSH